MNYGAQGYAGYFVTSLMDRHWRAGLSQAEGLALARQCIKEIRTRMTIGFPKFIIKMVTKDGIVSLPVEEGAPAAAAAAAAAPARGAMEVDAARA